ncbi:hypothetical protein PLICRDRAFT_174228 [Plicaturopsis crispa FD-325 SS-3]|nr:hypothetical protein PLICRDRAFT_174228 [Plicaturopsis crispa FD-325 SS-3]
MSLIHFRSLPNSQSALSDIHGSTSPHPVYSTWDNNRLRDDLKEKGVLTTMAEKEHSGLLALVHKAYASATAAHAAGQDGLSSASQFFFISHELYE